MWPGLHQVARPLMNAYSCLAKRRLHRACGKDQTSLGCNLLFLSLPHLLQRYLCPDGKKGASTKVDKAKITNKLIYEFMELVAYVFVKKISDSVASRNLFPTTNKVMERN